MNADHQDLVAQFCNVTGANPSQAQAALASNDWDLNGAVQLYYAAQEPAEEEDDYDDIENDEPQHPPAVSSLGGSAIPSERTEPSGARKPPAQQGKMRTLRDLQGSGNSDDEDEQDPSLFAGGEKSGLAVQNPGQGGGSGGALNHFQNIMNQARQNRERPPATNEEEQPQAPASSNFSGRAQTLGGDEAPSQVIEDPNAAMASRQPPPRVTRTLHLWDDGVSIDDGPLFRFDDPANAHIMAQINQGRAPLSMLDVQPDQEVDLNLNPHKGEKYVQPKAKYKPFSGQGQRLGSPTPGLSSPAAPPQPPSTAGGGGSATTGSEAKVDVDESTPTTTLQIRLADGTRLTSRFNTSHTIGDVYEFVGRASTASAGRSWVLMTTFPSKELTDKAQVLGETGEFKRGGVVVQKWT